MLESIHIGMTGLSGYSQGLRVIANNTANLNTPGFKGSALQFADLFYAGSDLSHNGNTGEHSVGFGLTTYTTTLNFKAGDIRSTGNDLDLAIDGQGLFILRNAGGELRYTRAGQFEFNAEGLFVNRADGSKVMASSGGGELREISLADLRMHGARATSKIAFQGNLSSTSNEQTVNAQVLDQLGGEHALTMRFNRTDQRWAVTVLEGSTSIGTGTLVFADGQPTTESAKFNITYTAAGLAPQTIELDFSTEVRSFASGDLSTLTVARQDGYKAGALNKVSFDTGGRLALSYTNQQTVQGVRLALARFDSPEAVAAVGDNQFRAVDEAAWRRGEAGDMAYGSIRSGSIEISNVDLSQQFSDLVIMQRGYQASSQVVSTANEMLQELFSMKGR